MSVPLRRLDPLERPALVAESAVPENVAEELHRLRQENRRLAVSLGGFSAFIASRGLLEEAWDYVNEIHRLEEGLAGD